MIYNTLNSQIIETDNPVIVNLVKKLNSKKNLLVLKLTAKDLDSPDISSFVTDVRRQFSGDLIDTAYSGGKPMQMRPQVKVQRDVEGLMESGRSYVGEKIMNYLSELFLYINNRCSRDCSSCSHRYKQFLHCTGGNKLAELEIEEIKRFLSDAQGSSLFSLNILGGDIFAYSRFAELVDYLNNHPKPKTYHTHYLNLENREKEIGLIDNASSSFNIFLDFPVKEDKLAGVAAMLQRLGMDRDAGYVFVIQKEEEIDSAQAAASRAKLTQFTLKPFYNGQNFNFFKNNIFVDKQELLLLKPSLKQIFSRMKLNPLNFGKITVLSDKSIYANVNAKKLGMLGSHSLYDVVLKEVYNGSDWRKSRDRVTPCKSCIYCYLCPPLTNYEYFLKRNNLCSIYNS